MRSAHSEKTLETLRLIGCTTTGWGTPDIEWKKVKMKVPTKMKCPTCHGTGQVSDEKARSEGTLPHHRFAMQPCPTCPSRRGYSQYGTGEVTKLVEQEVELGFYIWKSGTIFGSRYGHNVADQCELCGKGGIRRWVVVEGTDADGRYHVLKVGEDCGRTILGVSSVGTSMEDAMEGAANNKTKLALWREIPKPPKVKKPEKPKLADDVATKEQFEELVRAEFGATFRSGGYYKSRAQLEYSFYLDIPGRSVSRGYEVKLDARYGVTVRDPWGQTKKVFVKKKDSQDALGALREALPLIRKHAY